MSNFFAAIAISRSMRKVGYSWGAADQATAEQNALEGCAASDAKIVGWVRDGWGALAIGDDGHAFGWGPTAEQAEQVALHECGKVTRNGKINVLLHSQHGKRQPASTTTVVCPHCNNRVNITSSGGCLTCGYCQGQFTFHPVQAEPPKQQAAEACARCGGGVNGFSARAGSDGPEYCLACTAIVLPEIYQQYMQRKGYKVQPGGMDEPRSMPFAQVPCWACAQTGRIAGNGGPCPSCAGKGWRLEPVPR